MKITKEIRAEIKRLAIEKDEIIKKAIPIAKKQEEVKKKMQALRDEQQELLQIKRTAQNNNLSERTIEELEASMDKTEAPTDEKLNSIKAQLRILGEISNKLWSEKEGCDRKIRQVQRQTQGLKKMAFKERTEELIEEIKQISWVFSSDYKNPFVIEPYTKTGYQESELAEERFFEAYPEFKELEEIASGFYSDYMDALREARAEP